MIFISIYKKVYFFELFLAKLLERLGKFEEVIKCWD